LGHDRGQLISKKWPCTVLVLGHFLALAPTLWRNRRETDGAVPDRVDNVNHRFHLAGFLEFIIFDGISGYNGGEYIRATP
jgi:hypothetical protein